MTMTATGAQHDERRDDEQATDAWYERQMQLQCETWTAQKGLCAQCHEPIPHPSLGTVINVGDALRRRIVHTERCATPAFLTSLARSPYLRKVMQDAAAANARDGVR